jgi:DNA polymerase-3 subunit delta
MYGHLTLVAGPESFLAERAIDRLVSDARDESPQASLTQVTGEELTAGMVDQMAGADLFSSQTIAVVSGAEKTPKDVEPALLRLAHDVPDDVALVISHASGNLGKALLTKLTGLASEVVDCPAIKAWDLAKFVGAEVRATGKSIAQDAAQHLVDSVGTDTRSLAGAVSQLVSDTETDIITVSVVAQYFAGRATVTAFAVSDDALAGRVAEAIVKLRWALSTGVPHVLVTSALANSLRQLGKYLALSATGKPSAADIGVPPWKMKDVAATARSWSQAAVGAAIRSVSLADAQIKGAAQDPDFALERLVLRLASLRRNAKTG